jgi:hypothetical protein
MLSVGNRVQQPLSASAKCPALLLRATFLPIVNRYGANKARRHAMTWIWGAVGLRVFWEEELALELSLGFVEQRRRPCPTGVECVVRQPARGARSQSSLSPFALLLMQRRESARGSESSVLPNQEYEHEDITVLNSLLRAPAAVSCSPTTGPTPRSFRRLT